MQINKCNAAHKQNQRQTYMTIPIDAEKAFDKIQPFMIKALIKLGIEGMYFIIIKAVYDKPRANIKCGKTESIFFRSKTRMSSLPLFNIVVECLAGAIRPEQEIKGFQIEKEEVKLPLFPDNMISYLKDHKTLAKSFLNIINTFIKYWGYKISIQKSVAFLYSNNEQIKKKLRKTMSFTIASKKLPRNKFNEGKCPLLAHCMPCFKEKTHLLLNTTQDI
jgi:hypothetical protein